MKTVANFNVDFAGIVPVEAAEGDAVVEFNAAVGDVDGIERSRKALAEILAQREIESCVLRQIGTGIRLAGKRVTETGTIVDVRGGVGVPGKSDVAADVEGVALVVIERR